MNSLVPIFPNFSTSAPQNLFELDGDELLKPERLLVDWIELTLLTALLVVGLPLNVMVLIRLLRKWYQRKNAACSTQEVTRTSFLWLKIHLTVIDLIVIICYCPSHIAWLISYTWIAPPAQDLIGIFWMTGTFLCKTMQYSWDFCFHLMSFGVLLIAVDRVRTVYALMHMEKTDRALCQTSKQLIFVKRLIISCYIGAALFSLPQWFLWTTIDFKKWSQCTTIWHKARALQYVQNQQFTESFYGERIYTLVHLLTVFWLPFLILFVAYFYIVVYLFFYSIRPYSINTLTGTSTLIRTDSESSNENTTLWQNCASTLTSTQNKAIRNNSIKLVNNSGTVPAWRIEMRSKMFTTTCQVIAAYLICWMPYNVLSLATFFAGDLQIIISTHLELLRVCVLLNTMLNPFIYGFRKVRGNLTAV